VLPIPTGVANGTTVALQCGKTYQGTLDLNGKSNIIVNTAGTCGKASITPGSTISGWTLYQGNIYSAPIGFTPVQLSVAGNPVDAAHWPDGSQIWAPSGSSPPNRDVDGATLVYLENQSVVATQTISGATLDTSKSYYVEGKLWMLDSPGEWAVSNGRLYMWAPDGQSPEGRDWFSVIGAVVTDSTVANTGTVGRHKPTDAGIMFGDGKGNRIQIHNGVLDPGTPNEKPSQVLSSLVDTACVRLTDCGGIYTGARD
jgi:hypothetical protein